MNNSTINKIKRFNLNLDFCNKLNIENQTNTLINKYMNSLLKEITENNINTLILEYQDDLISLICYKILKNTQEIKKTKLYIFGKSKNTKKYFIDKESHISKRKMNKMNKENILFISSFNPIYKVMNIDKKYNKIDNINTFYIIDKFTPYEIKQAQIFYHIDYIKKDLIQKDLYNKSVLMQKYCDLIDNKLDNSYDSLKISTKYNKNINAVYLTGDINKDIKLLNNIEQLDEITFYFYNNEKPEILNEDNINVFEYYLKNKDNIPNENNINNEELMNKIISEYNLKLIKHIYKEENNYD